MKRTVVLVMVVVSVFAYGVQTQGSTTLLQLSSGDVTQIAANDKVFKDWSILDNNGLTDLALIEVDPLTDQLLNEGLRFTVQPGAYPPDPFFLFEGMDLIINYTVEVTDPLMQIKDNSIYGIFDGQPSLEIVNWGEHFLLDAEYQKGIELRNDQLSDFDEVSFPPTQSLEIQAAGTAYLFG
ncbi:MAG: hypothetical protein ACYSWU_17810, partial [Planctomycetota bacterium]